MKKTLMGAFVVALGLGATVPFVGWAQDQTAGADRAGTRPRRPGGPGGPGGRMGGPMGGAFAFREVMRDLTDAQREQVKAIHERHADRIRPLAERAHAAREALDNAVLSGNAGNLQALSIEVGNAETELTFAQAQVQSEIFNVLTRRTEADDRRAAEADGSSPRGNAEAETGARSRPGSGSRFQVRGFRFEPEPEPEPTGNPVALSVGYARCLSPFKTFSRRVASAAVLLLINGRAEAQGIGFQGGVTVDPEQGFVGTHFETGELFQNFRFRPGIDGGVRRRLFARRSQCRVPLSHSDRPLVEPCIRAADRPWSSCARTTRRARTAARSTRSASRTKTASSPISRSARAPCRR